MRKGQSTAEYAIVIGLVIAAAVAMQVYVKRGLQAKVKSAVDYTDSDSTSVMGKSTNQYEPYYMLSNMTSDRNANESEATLNGGGVSRATVTDVSTRTGTQTVANEEGAK